ncbi:unnamed protein product, partial [Durusdinium trenchii]
MSANINEVHLTWESCAQVRRLLRDTHSIFELEKGQDAPTINVKFASLNSEVLLPLMKALRAEGGDEVLMVTVPDLETNNLEMVVLSDDEADAAPAPEVKRGAPPDSQPLFGDEELEPEALCADAPLDEPMETDGEGKGTEDVVLASPTGLDKIEDASEQEFTAEDKRQPLDDPKANAKSHMFEEDDTDSLAVKKLK